MHFGDMGEHDDDSRCTIQRGHNALYVAMFLLTHGLCLSSYLPGVTGIPTRMCHPPSTTFITYLYNYFHNFTVGLACGLRNRTTFVQNNQVVAQTQNSLD